MEIYISEIGDSFHISSAYINLDENTPNNVILLTRSGELFLINFKISSYIKMENHKI